jgi:hypothetical protein
MNITELRDAVNLAFERGIDPLTSVVIDLQDRPEHDWFFHLDADVHDPAAPDNEDAYIWFTLTPTTAADCRFSPAHYPKFTRYRLVGNYGTFEVHKTVECVSVEDAFTETGIMATLTDAGWKCDDGPDGEEWTIYRQVGVEQWEEVTYE